MLYGIVLSLIAIAGIVLGVVRKIRPLAIGSAVLLVLVLAVWAYFYTNPY